MNNIQQCGPTADQELLLKALLSDDETAIQSWEAWRERVAFEHLDAGSQRLLPLLLDKLQRLDIKHPDLSKYRSVGTTTDWRNFTYHEVRPSNCLLPAAADGYASSTDGPVHRR